MSILFKTIKDISYSCQGVESLTYFFAEKNAFIDIFPSTTFVIYAGSFIMALWYLLEK